MFNLMLLYISNNMDNSVAGKNKLNQLNKSINAPVSELYLFKTSLSKLFTLKQNSFFSISSLTCTFSPISLNLHRYDNNLYVFCSY